jgi:acetyl-CoA acetyltransferase
MGQQVAYPIRDKVAIIGVGRSIYGRHLEQRSQGSLLVEAAKAAIRDAGIDRDEIDGVCGAGNPRGLTPPSVASALGLRSLSYLSSPGMLLGTSLIVAAHAVFSGQCTTVLVYHSSYRVIGKSRSAARDPFRVRISELDRPLHQRRYPGQELVTNIAYAAWANRYLLEYQRDRTDFGRVAINSRSGALENEHAVLRMPLSMEEYLAAPTIRYPFCMFDMDLPVDGADALVITAAERARDLVEKPVLLHASSIGMTDRPEEDQAIGLENTGQQVAMAGLWARSEFGLRDVDIVLPYDGYTVIALRWLETAGFCKAGEAGDLIASNWDDAKARILIDGRIAVNPHGGALAEGGTQGAGHIMEAVAQLRGHAGARQVMDARQALVLLGGFFYNSTTLMLRAG